MPTPLITPELEAAFRAVGRQEDNPDPVVVAKFFGGCATWYATEYLPESRLLFGYAVILEGEWGYVSVDELEGVRMPPLGTPIERDLHFTARPISQACPEAVAGRRIEPPSPKEDRT